MSNPSKSRSVKNWPASERPRERLLENGVEALSDAELVAIILRSGVQGKDVLALSRDLISKCGGVRGLLALSQHELGKIKGLGKAKIATLLASAEIAKRSLREKIIGTDFIRDPESVIAYLSSSLRDKKKEIFKILFLNRSNRIIEEADLFHGTVDEATIHVREVVQSSLERHASSVILVHNHPSGKLEPSPEDRHITTKLKTALATVSIKVLDHIIIGDSCYFSFSERGLLV